MGLKRYGGPPSAVEKADDKHADLPEACTKCVDEVKSNGPQNTLNAQLDNTVITALADATIKALTS